MNDVSDRTREHPEDRWLDAAAGPVVRPYAMTQGRTRSAQVLDVVALIIAVREIPARAGHEPEHVAILRVSVEPISVAEISAHLNLPLGVTRVLIGDLVELGCVAVREAPTVTELHSKRVLEAVINGLRAI
jgi:hypothetical protein